MPASGGGNGGVKQSGLETWLEERLFEVIWVSSPSEKDFMLNQGSQD